MKAPTAANFVYVDQKPILDCKTAEYFMLYMDYLTTSWEIASEYEMEHLYVGCQYEELLDYAKATRKIYKDLRDLSLKNYTLADPKPYAGVDGGGGSPLQGNSGGPENPNHAIALQKYLDLLLGRVYKVNDGNFYCHAERPEPARELEFYLNNHPSTRPSVHVHSHGHPHGHSH